MGKSVKCWFNEHDWGRIGQAEYVYRCAECGHEITHTYPMGKAPDTIMVVNYGSHDGGKCNGVLQRTFTVPNLNNVRRFGTAGPRDRRNK